MIYNEIMKKMFSYDNVTGLHLELTTKCNAMCPMCNRNFKGKPRDDLPISELTVKDIKTLLEPEFLKKLKLISVCGVYGEPICDRDLKKILRYIYKCNPNVDIDIYTNGGLYDEEWWSDLAKIMKKHNGTVIFGIDGVDETHSLHRRNTDFNTVIRNAKAYINAGGRAGWDFIVFKHNEHQVEAARKMSEELGFAAFQIKKTSRFLKNLYEHDEQLDSTILGYGKHPVYDGNGKKIYNIELPENKEYRNTSEDKLLELIKKYETIEKYFDSVPIDCGAIKSGGIFLSAQGEVFPCCTVYQQVMYKVIHGVKDETELNEYKLYTQDNLSAYDKSIKEIVEGKFFHDLFKSFGCTSIATGKPKSCTRACGKNLDVHAGGHTTKIKYSGGHK